MNLTRHIRRTKTGVPILSLTQMDALGEAIIADFSPERLTEPGEVDIEAITEFYLGLQLDFQFLSCCGKYLGMTVFTDTDKIIIYNPDKNAADYLKVKGGTVILDSTLLVPRRAHPFRFTLGHEAVGHALLHRPYFTGVRRNPLCQNQGISSYQTQRDWQDIDWLEWQADAMSAAVLLPRAAMYRFVRRETATADYQKLPSLARADFLARKLASIANVAPYTAKLRLKRLKFI